MTILAAAIIVTRSLALTRHQIGLRFPALRNWPFSVAVVFTGLGLGWVEYQIIHPDSLVDTSQIGSWLVPIGAIMFTAGLMEEFVFRGILQATTQAAFGPIVSIIYVGALFAVLHIGHPTLLNTAFAFAVGLYFGLVTLKTESLLAVVFAHGVLNVTALVILPMAT